MAFIVAVSIQLASLTSLVSYFFFYRQPYPTLIGALFALGALIGTWRIVLGDDDT